MNILTVGCSFVPALQAAGHRVLDLLPDKDQIDLPALLDALRAEQDFIPDLLFQQEVLGHRLLLRNVERAPCPSAFLAVDSHLNMFWHRHYARLFDTLLTPHVSLFAALPPEWRHPNVRLFPHIGVERGWKPFSERPHALGLCARLTPARQLRGWMVELLAPRGLALKEELAFGPMLDFYGDTRVVPNESIGFEVNFRLFEGASCGCLVLSQDCGPDQAAVFTAGKEMFVWHDGLELLELETFFRTHPESAEKVGRAARERVLAEHLPKHRAETLAALALEAPAGRAAGPERARIAWLCETELARNGMLRISIPWLLERGETMADDPEVLAGMLRLRAESKRGEEALAMARRLPASSPAPASLELNAAASAAAMQLGDFATARALVLHHARNGGAIAIPEQSGGSPEDDAVAMAMAWAEALRRAKRLAQPGDKFNPDRGGIPESAYGFMQLARRFSPAIPALAYLKAAVALSAQIRSYAVFHMGHLAELSLRDPGNWRAQLDCGLAFVGACRVEAGIQEIRLARTLAAEKGQEKSFARALAARPSGAYIERLLAISGAGDA